MTSKQDRFVQKLRVARWTGRGALFAFVFVLVATGMWGAAQSAALETLDLNELDSSPARVEVSPDYLTIIEFEGMSVESALSGRSDQITTQIADNIISVRANQEEVNTDLFVRVGGRTALFRLVSNPSAQSPKRYVVSDEQPPERSLQGSRAPGGLSRPADTGLPPPPPGLTLRVSAYRPNPEAVVIQYALTNNTAYPIVNDPLRLRVYLEGVTREYERTASPTPGRAGRLAMGESEYGQIVVPGVPANAESLELEWMLVAIGPGTVYQATSDLLVALGEKTPGVASDAETSEAPVASSGGAPGGTPFADAAPATESVTEQPTGGAPSTAQRTDGPSGLTEAQVASETLVLSADAFDGGDDAWWVYTDSAAEAVRESGDSEACVLVTGGGSELWDVAFGRSGVALREAQQYLLSFDARADKPVTFRSAVGIDSAPWTETFAQVDTLGPEMQNFTYAFSARRDFENNRLAFYLGQNETAPYRVCFDNVVLAEVVGPSADAALSGDDADSAQARADEQPETQDLTDIETAPVDRATPPTDSIADSTDAPTDVPAQNQGPAQVLIDESFSEAAAPAWSVYAAPPGQGDIEGAVEDGAFCSVTTNAGSEHWNVGVLRESLSLTNGKTYTLSFSARADKPISLRPAVTLNDQPWAEIFGEDQQLSAEMQTYSYTFDAAGIEEDGWLVFFLGGNGDVPYRVCFDNIVLAEADVPVAETADAPAAAGFFLNETFEGEAAAWEEYTIQQAEMTYEVSDGEACTVTSDGGSAIWDVGLVREALPFEDDQAYTLTFDAYADRPMLIRSAITLDEVPWTEVFGQTQELSMETRSYGYSFDAVGLERGGRLIFFLGGSDDTPYRVCFDNVTITPTPGEGALAPTDSNPSAASESAQMNAAGDQRSAMLVTGAASSSENDALLARYLAQLGFNVQMEDAASVLDADIRGADVVVVSPSVSEGEIGTLFRDAAVPIVTSSADLFGLMGMTGDTRSIYYGNEDSVALQFVTSEHPLSAGLSGPVLVLNEPHELAWGTPSLGATVVATIPGDETKATIFAYEAGAPMVGITAPARRVGLFHGASGTYNDDAWALFSAAVEWAAQTSVPDAASN